MRRWAWILAVAGCADDGSPPLGSGTTTGMATSVSPPPTSGSSSSDGGSSTTGEASPPEFWVQWDGPSLTLSLMRDDVALLRFPADGLQWATADAVDPEASYDPVFPFDAQWRDVVAGEEVDGGTLSVRLEYDGGGHATIRIEETEYGRFSASWLPDDDAPTLVAYRFQPRTDPRRVSTDWASTSTRPTIAARTARCSSRWTCRSRPRSTSTTSRSRCSSGRRDGASSSRTSIPGCSRWPPRRTTW